MLILSGIHVDLRIVFALRINLSNQFSFWFTPTRLWVRDLITLRLCLPHLSVYFNTRSMLIFSHQFCFLFYVIWGILFSTGDGGWGDWFGSETFLGTLYNHTSTYHSHITIWCNILCNNYIAYYVYVSHKTIKSEARAK